MTISTDNSLVRRTISSRYLSRVKPAIAGVVGLSVAAALMSVASPSLAATPTGTGVAVPSSGMLFGAAAYSSSGMTMPGLEATTGRTMAMDRVYSQWDDVQPANQAKADASAGRTTLLSIRPQYRNGTKIPWASVANGDQDPAIRTQIAGLQSFGRPIMLAFHHEADLSSGYGTPADFRAAFAHYVTIARATGETNISFVLVLSAYNYSASQITSWYPGDDVVDWAGADAYNFGACTPGRPAWRTFDKAVAPFRTWGETHNKPQVLAEWGTAEDPAVPNAKADWITAAGVSMASWTQLHATSYFDEPGSCDWSLETSASSMNAFATLSHTTNANAAATARLGATTLVGRQQNWDATPSTGTAHTTGTGVTSWTFDAGDGLGVRNGTGKPGAISHTYAKAGKYTAVLTVADADGGSETTTNKVTIA